MTDRSMTRSQYDALRRAAWEASKAYCREADSDGRSSYRSHSIRIDHALREAHVVQLQVPRNRVVRSQELFNLHTQARRRAVERAIYDRNFFVKHSAGPLWPGDPQPILRSKNRAIREVLRRMDPRIVRGELS